MMEVLLFLSAFFCVGFSYQHRNYGETFEILILSNALNMRFTPVNNGPPAILWRRSDFPFVDYGRHKVKGDYFVIHYLTQEDSGTYELLDYRSRAISTKKLLVKETTQNFTRGIGESLEVIYYLERWKCNIVFMPDHGSKGFEIIQRGSLVKQNSDCLWFESTEPCGFVNANLQVACQGRYEFKDSRGNLAMVAFLQMKKPHYSIWDVIIGLLDNIILGLCCIFILTCCYGCMKHCCCDRGSDDKDESPEDEAETEPAQPAEQDNVPVRHSSPPSGTRYRTFPSSTPPAPLIHSPPPEIPLPVYSEISAPVKQEDALTGPVSSDSEPQFELKGMDFDSVLGSSSTGDGVYTSDKLSFL